MGSAGGLAHGECLPDTFSLTTGIPDLLPGAYPLKRSSDLEQEVFTSIGSNELYANRHPAVGRTRRDRQGGYAGRVGETGECALMSRPGAFGRPWHRAGRWCQQQVILCEETSKLRLDLSKPGQCIDIVQIG